MASCRSYQFLFSLMSFAIILCGAHANAESVDVSSFPFERSYSLAPDA
jgi:hypothetical protein